MNVKKAVMDKVRDMLNNELRKCNNKIWDNKNQFARLTEEQTTLKRERVKLAQMLRDLD